MSNVSIVDLCALLSILLEKFESHELSEFAEGYLEAITEVKDALKVHLETGKGLPKIKMCENMEVEKDPLNRAYVREILEKYGTTHKTLNDRGAIEAYGKACSDDHI